MTSCNNKKQQQQTLESEYLISRFATFQYFKLTVCIILKIEICKKKENIVLYVWRKQTNENKRAIKIVPEGTYILDLEGKDFTSVFKNMFNKWNHF